MTLCVPHARDRLRVEGAWPNAQPALRFDKQCVRDRNSVLFDANSSIGNDDFARDGVVSVSRTALLEDKRALYFRQIKKSVRTWQFPKGC